MQKNFMTVDIGGSLMKLILVEYTDQKCIPEALITSFSYKSFNYQVLDTKNNKYFNDKSLKLHFFLMNKSIETIGFVQNEILSYLNDLITPERNVISITGACAKVFKQEFTLKLNGNKEMIEIKILPLEFLTSYAGVLIINEINSTNTNEIFKYEKLDESETGEFLRYERVNVKKVDDSYIYLSIGTGTSILYINKNKVTYLQHSNISGATYLGLCKLICNCDTFEEAIRASEEGDFKKVDYTIRDLISDKKENLDAIAETMKESHVTESGNAEGPEIDFIINSFGKCTLDSKLSTLSPSKHDLANSTLMMVINSCSLNAYHFAKYKNCKQIIFGGSFLTNNSYGKSCTGKLVRYLSNGCIDALFFEKDAFINALGCFFDFESNKVDFESFM